MFHPLEQLVKHIIDKLCEPRQWTPIMTGLVDIENIYIGQAMNAARKSKRYVSSVASISTFPEDEKYAEILNDPIGGQKIVGRYRVNVQIGIDQLHVLVQLPQIRTFNLILDELQSVIKLSSFQRLHTRIYLQTILGETEILVNSRPNFATERNIDYVGIPANPTRLSSVQRNGRFFLSIAIILALMVAGLGTFIAVDFLVLRRQLENDIRRSIQQNSIPPRA